MVPLQHKHAIRLLSRLNSLRTQPRTFVTAKSLHNWLTGNGSPVSDGGQNQYSCFCAQLSQKVAFPNGFLKSVWISNPLSRSISKSSVTAADKDEKKITIGPSNSNEKDNNVVYYGPISDTIRRVKLLSLSTCCLSVSLGPVITFLTSPDLNVIVKGAVASTVIFFSASTTGMLHWFVSPYVHKLKWKPGSDIFEVEVLSWLATYLPRTIQFSDVQPADTNRPYVTFKAKGNYYYIDIERFQNKALLARLTPKQPTTAPTLKNL